MQPLRSWISFIWTVDLKTEAESAFLYGDYDIEVGANCELGSAYCFTPHPGKGKDLNTFTKHLNDRQEK